MSDKVLFDKIAESIKVDHPSFSVKFKDESRNMKTLGLLAYPFNDRFEDGYTTTLGSTVYFPSKEVLAKAYRHFARVLAHEGVHIFDDGLGFKAGYAMFEGLFLLLLALYSVFGSWMPVLVLLGGLVASYGVLAFTRPPRLMVRAAAIDKEARKKADKRKKVAKVVFLVMAGMSVVAYVVVAVLMSKWWTFLAVGSFLPLLPITSHWRAKSEYRGYAMGIAISYWRYGEVRDSDIERRISTFTGPNYYFMDRNEERVRRKLNAIKLSVIDGSILVGLNARPYQRTLDVLKRLGLTSAGSKSA